MPVRTRRTAQAGAESACVNARATTAATAARLAKARIWPTCRMKAGPGSSRREAEPIGRRDEADGGDRKPCACMRSGSSA